MQERHGLEPALLQGVLHRAGLPLLLQRGRLVLLLLVEDGVEGGLVEGLDVPGAIKALHETPITRVGKADLAKWAQFIYLFVYFFVISSQTYNTQGHHEVGLCMETSF